MSSVFWIVGVVLLHDGRCCRRWRCGSRRIWLFRRLCTSASAPAPGGWLLRSNLSPRWPILSWIWVFFWRRLWAEYWQFNLAFGAGDMGRENLFPKPVFVNHDLEINVDIFATCKVVGFFLLFLSLHVLHLYSPLLPLLFYFFDPLHLEFIYIFKSRNCST